MKLAIRYCEETIELVYNIESAFISLGERLYKIQNERLWEGRWDSYKEYLSDIKISPGKASKIVSIYETYVLKYHVPVEKLSCVGWSSLYTMLVAVEDEKSAHDWVEKGTILRREDIEDEVRDIRLGRVCEHKDCEDFHLKVCLDCKKRFRVYE